MTERTRVDETDFRILREVFLGEHETLHSERVAIDAIAKTLTLHRNTVSQRLKRLTEKRIFLPASLDVEPAALGLAATIASLDVPAEKRTDAARDRLFDVPGVQTLITLADGWRVIAYAEDETTLEARLDDMRRAVDAPPARVEMWSPRDYPPAPRATLSPLDTRLLAELLLDARAPFPELAKRLDTTAMTAQRRFEKLSESGVLYMLPASCAPIEGVVLGWITADLPEPATEARAKAALQRLLPDALVRNLATRARSHFILFAPAVDDLEASARAARELPGVAAVDLKIVSSILRNPRYPTWMAERIRATLPARA
ncbi:MAG: AsnC family transcriptional regulator [Thermoplasmatota archaeon]